MGKAANSMIVFVTGADAILALSVFIWLMWIGRNVGVRVNLAVPYFIYCMLSYWAEIFVLIVFYWQGIDPIKED